MSRSRRRQIVVPTQQFGIPVLQVPSVEEITRGRVRKDAQRPMQVEELLVSDTRGLIGSELSRQTLRQQPKVTG